MEANKWICLRDYLDKKFILIHKKQGGITKDSSLFLYIYTLTIKFHNNMVMVSNIFLSIWGLLMIGCFLSLIILGGSSKITLFQYLYLRFFAEKEDWHNYVEMNKYIDSGHSIPIMELHDFTHMQCDPSLKEKYSEFISNNPYYFLIFNTANGPELCGYSTSSNKCDNIIFSSFYQKLCLKMARKMGYTHDKLCSMLKDGLVREKYRRTENARRVKELEGSLKELHERQERLDEKTE